MTENPEAVTLLLVEDNPGDAKLIRRYLTQSNFTDMEVGAEVTHVESLAAARERYRDSDYDVVFLDLGLPESTGLETVERFLDDDPNLPMVVLTGLDDRDTAVRAIEMGAQDYLVKDKIDGYTISRSLRYAIQRYERTRELQRRKRELERALTLNRAIQDIAVQSRTRNEVELEFCRRLVEEPARRFAWVGEPDDSGALDPRVLAGPDDGYLDDVDRSLDQAEPPPAVAAATDLTPQFVTDVQSAPDTDWRQSARQRGIESIFAVPLRHDGVSYGVLAVYATEAGAFDEGEGELLVDLSETLASSIERAELRTALAADRVAEVELQLTGDDYFLLPVARELAADSGGSVAEVLETVPHDEAGHWQFFAVDGADAERFQSRLEACDEVVDVRAVDGPDGRNGVRAHIEADTPESTLADNGGVVHGTIVTPNHATIVVAFRENKDVRDVVGTLEETFGPVAVQRYQKRSVDRDLSTLLDRCDLTTKQASALRTAYRFGYFEDTREHYAEEVAEALGVSRPTFQRHLRSAERKIFRKLLDDPEPDVRRVGDRTPRNE